MRPNPLVALQLHHAPLQSAIAGADKPPPHHELGMRAQLEPETTQTYTLFEIDRLIRWDGETPLNCAELVRAARHRDSQIAIRRPMHGVERGAVGHGKSRRPLRHSQRKTRFFEMLTHMGWRLSDTLKIAGKVDDKYAADRARLAAWTELDEPEIGPFVALLQDENLLGSRDGEYRLTPKGFEELERVQGSATDSANAFVAMWFDASMDEAYEKGIEPAIRRAGYVPIRIDKKEHNNKIDDEIIADIKRSRFIVADFTCATVTDGEGRAHALPRGGVYFEAGFAYGLGLPVVWVCREDHMGLVHFDTNHFAHILWQTPAELEERLYNRIVHVVGLGPGAHA